ncbi:hypothetical protein V2632_02970, partial [Tenacibaculum maritimum]
SKELDLNMKNFEKFVDEIVIKWRSEKNNILESHGLAGIIISNREAGDSAEDYILRKVKNLKQKYIVKKSKGSQSPSDIFAVAGRGRFWHIMLIQVKSSTDQNSIYELSSNEIKVFGEFAKFLKKELKSSELMKSYKDSSIVISTGYAGVYNNMKSNRHSLWKSNNFNSYKSSMSTVKDPNLKLKIDLAHSLTSS